MSSALTQGPNNISPTKMFQEAGESGAVIARQLPANADLYRDLRERFHARKPSFIATCARGSSDHAGLFAKHLFETQLNVPIAPFAPSSASIYGASFDMRGAWFLAISQSGASPDLIASISCAKQNGAYCIAIVNTPDSPLAALADCVIPMHAGAETSVAATKSYVATLSAIANIVFRIADHSKDIEALSDLPGQVDKAWALDWSPMVEPFRDITNLFVLGRGSTFSVAKEAALKFKECCGIHAQAFSAAEVKHGPMAIIGKGFPILAFAPQEAAQPFFEAVMDDLQTIGATIFGTHRTATTPYALPVLNASSPYLSPILQIVSFYKFANNLALARGLNPDEPPFLKKITKTS